MTLIAASLPRCNYLLSDIYPSLHPSPSLLHRSLTPLAVEHNLSAINFPQKPKLLKRRELEARQMRGQCEEVGGGGKRARGETGGSGKRNGKSMSPVLRRRGVCLTSLTDILKHSSRPCCSRLSLYCTQ